MKVSYVTMRFPSRPETFACTDVRVLREAGVDVSVYTMRAPQADPGALLDERGLSGLTVNQGTPTADLLGLASCVRHPAIVGRLLIWLLRSAWRQPVQLMISILLIPRSIGIFVALRREQPDVVHLFWGHYPCIVAYLVLARMPDTVLSVFLGAYDLTRGYAASALIARQADLIWTHAQCNVSAIQALGVPPERIHLAYRGMDLRLFSPHAPKIKQRIISVGRLIPSKAMDQVLLAFRDAYKRWPATTLTIVGEGPERKRLEGLTRTLDIDSVVTFTGHLKHTDVAKEMAKAEVLLLMSRKDSERLPNVVKEAMATRCLCVVAETPGIDELLRDRQNGFLVRIDDAQSAAARIDDIFRGRVDKTAMLDAASDHVARRFDVSTSMAHYRSKWFDAVTARRAGRLARGQATPVSTHRVEYQTVCSDPMQR